MDAKLYPSSLIPKSCWLHRIDVNKLVGVDVDAYVARRIEGEKDECIDTELGPENAFLNAKALGNSDVPNMSLSLLGTLFKTGDLRFRQTGDAMKDWDGKRVESKPLIEGFVHECEKEWFAVAWDVKGLHEQLVPYKKEFSREKDYNKFIQEINRVTEVIKMEFSEYKDSVAPLEATTRLQHSPTLLNYWHFVFDIYPMGSDTPLRDIKPKWAENLAEKTLKQCLRFNFYFVDDLQITPLNSKIWKKSVCQTLKSLV